MAEKTIEQRVKDIIVEQLGVNPDQVTPEAKFAHLVVLNPMTWLMRLTYTVACAMISAVFAPSSHVATGILCLAVS